MLGIETDLQGSTAVMRVSGNFDGETRQMFARASKSLMGNEKVSKIEIDVSSVSYIDSSACGMLHVVKDKAVQAGKTIAIVKAKGLVKSALGLFKL